MKKTLMIAATSAFLISGFAATEATAGSYIGKCKSCHKANKDGMGPGWNKVQAAYGSADALAAVFESGFAVADRKVAATDAKYGKKGNTKTMSKQYKKIAKDMKKGKTSAADLAAAVFAQ